MKKAFVKISAIVISAIIFIQLLPLSSIAASVNEYKAAVDFSTTKDETNSPIVDEQISKRTEYSKTFLREDGSFTKVVTVDPIHYAENGKWEDIDNTLTLTKDANRKDVYSNSQNSFSIEAPKTMNKNSGFIVLNDKYGISFKVNNMSESSAVIDNSSDLNEEQDAVKRVNLNQKTSEIKYKNILNNTDLEYVVSSEKVKENIIVNSVPAAQPVYSYTITLSNTEPRLNKDGSISFLDGDNEIYYIQAPYMFDADENLSKGIKVSLTANSDSSYKLTYTPSIKWLTDAERSYPVTIDPTITVRNTTRCVEANPGNRVGSDYTYYDYIQHYTNAGTDINAQFFIRYNDGTFPMNVSVKEATIGMYCSDNSSSSSYSNVVSAYMGTEAWTTSTAQVVDTSNMSVLDYNVIPSSATESQYVWDITNAVGLWTLNMAPNYGIIFAANSSNQDTNVKIRHSANNFSWQQPILTVTYENDVEIQNNVYPYHTVDMGRAGTVYINEFTRKLSLTRDELSVDGSVMPVSIQRSFFGTNFSAPQSYAGAEWKINFYAQAVYSTENDLYYFMGFDGKQTNFTNSGETDSNGRMKYLPQRTDMSEYVLWRNAGAAGNDYTNVSVVKEDDCIYYYNSIGRISKIVDTKNEAHDEINLNYISATSVSFTEIIDGVGRKYKFLRSTFGGITALSRIQLYDANDNPVVISTPSGQVNVQTQYSYTTINNAAFLTSVTYPDGEEVFYTYNSAGNMTSITNIDGSKLTIDYSGNAVTGYTKTVYDDSTQSDITEETYSIDADAYNERTISSNSVFDSAPSEKTVQYDRDFNQISIINGNGDGVYRTYNQDGGITTASYKDEISSEDIIFDEAFSSSSGWSASPSGAGDIVTGDNPCYALAGNPSGQVFAYKRIAINGQEDDVFTLDAYAKANAASQKNNRSFSIVVKATDENGDATSEVLSSYEYNDSLSGWQNGLQSFKLPSDMQYVYIYLVYNYQVNTALFDDILLYKSNADINDINEEDPITNSFGEKTETKDTHGNVLTSQNSDGSKYIETSTSYTSNGNYPASMTDQNGNSMVLNCNTNNGNLESTTISGDTTNLGYNAVGYLRLINQAVSGLSNGTSISNEYTYSKDTITSITHNGFSYNFEYDVWGNDKDIKVGNQSYVTYSYDDDIKNQLNTITFGNGDTISYTYSDGNVTGISLDNGQTFAYNYEYDNNGMLVSCTDNLSGWETISTETGIEVRKLSDNSLLYSSEKDSDNPNETIYQVLSKTFTKTQNYSTYDADTGARTASSSLTGTNVDINTYTTSDYFNRPVESQIANSIHSAKETYTYKALAGDRTTNMVDSFTSVLKNGSNEQTAADQYTYDDKGNITEVLVTDPYLNWTYTLSYAYDEANQLVREDNEFSGETYAYAYDAGGNIVSKKRYPYTTGSLTSITPTETVTYTYGDSNWKDKLTSYNGQTIAYDEIGNPLNKAGMTSGTYEWEGRTLKAFTDSSGNRYEYKYNADGLRTKKIAHTSSGAFMFEYDYFWENGVLIDYTYKYANGVFNNVKVLYDENGQVYGIAYTMDLPSGASYSNTLLFQRNAQGDIVAAATDSSNGTIYYYYDAFGNVIYEDFSGAADAYSLNIFAYRGYMYDRESGMYYLQSRYYDPEVGRFINADAYMDTGSGVLCTNMFAYCANNPVIGVDYNGFATTYAFGTFNDAFPGLPASLTDDDGKYDKYAKPSLADRLKWVAWKTAGIAAYVLQYDDGALFYQHYLTTADPGTDYTFDYEEAYNEDKNIKKWIDAEIENAKKAVKILLDPVIGTYTGEFFIEATTWTATTAPATINWKLALGSHYFLIRGWATYDSFTEEYTYTMTIWSKDRYNFSPTGVFGKLPVGFNNKAVTYGWAHPYWSIGSFDKTVTWK